MRRSEWCTWVCGMFLFCAVTAIASPAQTFTTLVRFDGQYTGNPQYGSLVQGTDGNLYGTTSDYFTQRGFGTVFKMTPDGTHTTLHSFCAQPDCPDGGYPYSGLVDGADGSFYGTTFQGGANGNGTVFAITPKGTLTTVYSFCSQPDCSDGGGPYAGLLRGTDGNFYGMTALEGRGINFCADSDCGTIFKITPGGTLTTLYRFCNQTGCPDGAVPYGSLIQGKDGNLYGTTYWGGTGTCTQFPHYGCGTIFRITPQGHLATMHSFNSQDGAHPIGALFQGRDGSLYGTTSYGGLYTYGGTIFRITPAGDLSTLYNFCSDFPTCATGTNPAGGLVQATDGKFYGTTKSTIFKISPAGVLRKLHTFTFENGWVAEAALLQDTNGAFYGTARDGGKPGCDNGCGTVFGLDMGLGPFVAFVRDSGKVGGTGGILGQGFTGTSGVSLDGTPVNFTVVSDTFLKATVPDGATTGFVTVTTPSGTLTSNKPFRVRPQLLTFDPPSGPVGTQVTITGVSLTQTQGVGFGNRVPAQFTVNSDTKVTATVPAGAKTGKVGIETKGGTAISSGTFTVTP
ncbi:MAG: hypothetical protein LAO09_06355 [Acidobacteriia bacterium]|nr:hypothetical protein [Terriglobia bacterium]